MERVGSGRTPDESGGGGWWEEEEAERRSGEVSCLSSVLDMLTE